MTLTLGLTARAFGADEVILSGDDDPTLLRLGNLLRLGLVESLVADTREANEMAQVIFKIRRDYSPSHNVWKPWNEITDKIPLEGEVSVVVGGQSPRGTIRVSQLQCRSREPTTFRGSRTCCIPKFIPRATGTRRLSRGISFCSPQ